MLNIWLLKNCIQGITKACVSFIIVYACSIVNLNQPKQYDRADIGRCSKRGQASNGMVPMFASDAPANIRSVAFVVKNHDLHLTVHAII